MEKTAAALALSGAALFGLGLATGLTAQVLTDSPQRKEQKRTDLMQYETIVSTRGKKKQTRF